MIIKQRLEGLKQAYLNHGNDEIRYRLAQMLRDLGYLHFRDFSAGSPPTEHISAIERLLLE